RRSPPCPIRSSSGRGRSTSRRSGACRAASWRSAVRDQMERLVGDMLDKGVHYEDARREVEKLFISRALQRTNGNLCDAADLLGLHRNTIARKIAEYRIKRTA